MEPAIHILRHDDAKGRWRNFNIIRDGAVTVLEMEPAMLAGWNVRSVLKQSGDDWGDMSAETILAWKLEQYPDYVVVADDAARAKVLKLETQYPTAGRVVREGASS